MAASRAYKDCQARGVARFVVPSVRLPLRPGTGTPSSERLDFELNEVPGSSTVDEMLTHASAATVPTRADASESAVLEGVASTDQHRQLRIVSLFSGIGGLDLGLSRAGHQVVEMCESWEPARTVLNAKFPGIPIADDVRTYAPAVEYDLLTAGFPCVDISHAGKQTGIFGPQSGLVEHVFRIVAETAPAWIVLENVPNLLRLQKGAGIAHIIDRLTGLGYAWAYRVIDSRSSGVAQRRNRVIVLASRVANPADYLLAAEGSVPAAADSEPSGFYWTEGRRGIGLVHGAVPTLKGGSTVGAPSAPAIWDRAAPLGKRFVLPTVEDGEELQGFTRGWTAAADVKSRWKLVGNAVTVGVAEWLGEALAVPAEPWAPPRSEALTRSKPWPESAWGTTTESWRATATRFPTSTNIRPLSAVVDAAARAPLSHRATAGFLSRVNASGIVITQTFRDDLESHLAAMEPARATWTTTATTRARMKAVKHSDTTPERAIRRALTRLGLRYRLQVRVDPTRRWTSDIVFIGPRVIVDVRGCYWHACPEHGTLSRTNTSRWASKFVANAERDARMVAELTTLGWVVVVVWEHDDPDEVAEQVAGLVAERASIPRRAPA